MTKLEATRTLADAMMAHPTARPTLADAKAMVAALRTAAKGYSHLPADLRELAIQSEARLIAAGVAA